MNKIELSGIARDIHFNHEFFNEKFYKFYISCTRLSGEVDVLPCIVSETLVSRIEEDKPIKVIGFIRTRKVCTEDRPRLDVYVFVRELAEHQGEDENVVTIDGYICKEPTYRETPKGRQLSDILIATGRPYSKSSDYIPSICWGRYAKAIAFANVGTHIKGVGRFQSRVYEKHIGDLTEARITYELSLNNIRIKECDSNED